MNQDIIVDDDLDWQSERQGIAFTTHWQGRKIDCFLALAHLEHMTGQSLIDEGNIMLAFESVRFDIEERVAELVGEEAFAPDGGLYL